MKAPEQRHPEDYCHRCGGPNISWYTPGGVWDPVMRPLPGEPWKWDEIICPTCFVSLAGGGTWALIPMRDDGERWTSADEREQIKDAAVSAVRDEQARCQYVSPSPWGPAQCVLANGHDGRHAYSPSEALEGS